MVTPLSSSGTPLSRPWAGCHCSAPSSRVVVPIFGDDSQAPLMASPTVTLTVGT